LPRAAEIGLDGRVLLFTFAISLLTGVLAGLAPAWKISQWRLAETLKQGGRGTGGGQQRAQGVLVAVEMALALVLLVGAGLLIRSLSALWQVDPGFQTENVLTFGISLPPSISVGQSASPEAGRANLRDLSDKLKAIPGVRAAALTTGEAPLQSPNDLSFWREGQPKPADASQVNMSLFYRVEPGYLTALGIPLKQGRFFTEQDDERAPAVAVIDEAFARQYFPRESPLGKRINLGGDLDPWQIVGVVGHVKQWSLDADERQSLQAQLYLPFRQAADSRPTLGVVMRVEGVTEKTGAAFFENVRRVVQNQHSQNVIFGTQTMNEVIAGSLAARRFSMILLNAFAVVALLLASVGLYGVISYLVGQRTQEIGVRMALGAGRRDVLRLVLQHGMKMALSGVALGLIAAVGLTRLLATMLYGVSATDPTTFVVIALLLVMVALLACFVPAWRATKVDPLTALRHE
ncbi:MAG: ABC transporter permease, partial [Blastocatellia bacterium]